MKTVIIQLSRADSEMEKCIGRFIADYRGDDLLHDIELEFPTASYRAVYVAFGCSDYRLTIIRTVSA